MAVRAHPSTGRVHFLSRDSRFVAAAGKDPQVLDGAPAALADTALVMGGVVVQCDTAANRNAWVRLIRSIRSPSEDAQPVAMGVGAAPTQEQARSASHRASPPTAAMEDHEYDHGQRKTCTPLCIIYVLSTVIAVAVIIYFTITNISFEGA